MPNRTRDSIILASCHDATIDNQLENKPHRRVPKDQKFISQKKFKKCLRRII